MIAAGEGEMLVPTLGRAFSGTSDRVELLHMLARLRGFYIPSLYEPQYAGDGTLAGFALKGDGDASLPVRKAALKTTDAVDPPVTSIFTPDTEFGSRFLVE
ncbi:MAG: B12-binding domain-containing radical SAM protein, partial [Acidobacteria bacterium]